MTVFSATWRKLSLDKKNDANKQRKVRTKLGEKFPDSAEDSSSRSSKVQLCPYSAGCLAALSGTIWVIPHR